MPATQAKILVIRGGAIGDFILTLPVLAALRQQFPRAELEVLGYPHIAQLALAGGLASRVQSIEARPLAGFFARNGELAKELAEYFAGFQLIISYLYDPDEIFKTNVGRCTRAQFIPGPHRPDEKDEVHATEVFLKPLERLAIFEADAVPRLDVTKAFETTLTTGRWLAVHPGSGSENKNWPEAKWNELLQQLMSNTKLKLLLIGGEAERERLDRLARALPSTRIKIMKGAPLSELAQWLASCVGFVGHDSGISHLASAVGVRSLILWGETDEAVWRPRGREMTMLRDSKGLEQLSVPVVLHHLEQLLKRD
ncbi:MAG TPA: glycosyltransferase family 9 protein [Verrucomicrobiae bacterium]|jgi:heptosyltransferase-2|nr:glycosyltransferase family 9 protein [Verrucomicrobiae bacterium]